MPRCTHCNKNINTNKDYRFYKYVKRKKGVLSTKIFCCLDCLTRWKILRLDRYKSLEKGIEKAEQEIDHKLIETIKPHLQEKYIIDEARNQINNQKKQPKVYSNNNKRTGIKYGLKKVKDKMEYILKPTKIASGIKAHFGLQKVEYDDVKWDKKYVPKKNFTKKQRDKNKQDIFNDEFNEKYAKNIKQKYKNK